MKRIVMGTIVFIFSLSVNAEVTGTLSGGNEVTGSGSQRHRSQRGINRSNRCDPEFESQQCQEKWNQCKKDFLELNFTPNQRQVIDCRVHKQCKSPIVDYLKGCAAGGLIGVHSVVEWAGKVAAGTKNLVTGESFRRMATEMEAEFERMKPFMAKVEAICGKNPYSNPEAHEHKVSYFQKNEINAFEFEEAEAKYRRSLQEYQICEIRTLQASGAYPQKEKMGELLKDQLKLLGVKTDCYSKEALSEMICTFATQMAVTGGAVGVALKSIRGMTGLSAAIRGGRSIDDQVAIIMYTKTAHVELKVGDRVYNTLRSARNPNAPMKSRSAAAVARGGKRGSAYYQVNLRVTKSELDRLDDLVSGQPGVTGSCISGTCTILGRATGDSIVPPLANFSPVSLMVARARQLLGSKRIHSIEYVKAGPRRGPVGMAVPVLEGAAAYFLIRAVNQAGEYSNHYVPVQLEP